MRIDLAQSRYMAARGNRDAIEKLFAAAANAIREGRPIPEPAADYLASALESAGPKPDGHQGAMLLEELGLRFGHRPPANVDPYAVAMGFIYRRVFTDMKVADIVAELADKHGVEVASINRILKNQGARACANVCREHLKYQKPPIF